MERNFDNRKRRGGNKDRPSLNNASYGEKFPPIIKPERKEYPPCPISGAPIENIFTAINHRETNQPANFDAFVKYLREAEQLSDKQFLLYVGSGTFGVYEEELENGRKKMVQVRKIVYEDSHEKPLWRKELSPGISRDYIPNPTPLSQLYSLEEEQAFPKIGATNGAYLPRNS